MKATKKAVAILAILAIVCCCAFATDAEATKRESGWNINVGTAYIVSHIGASYDFGRWEFGGNLYSGFPNVPIIAFSNGSDESFSEMVKQSLTLAYAGNVNALYDVTKSDKVDVDLGLAVSGLYSDLEKFIGLKGSKLGIVSLDVAARVKFNIGNHSGIYLATEAPIAGVFIGHSVDSETGQSETEASVFAVTTEDYAQALVSLMVYTTRVGYVYSF